MACACHGQDREKVTGKVRADDQCATCALKHLEMAVVAWGEFLYEEANRRWVASHLRLCVEHLKIDHRGLAESVREVAEIIENALDKDTNDIKNRFDGLHAVLLGIFKKDNPEYAKRLEKLIDMK